MTSLEVAHLNVKVNCTKPLPSSAKIERENGDIVRVSIDYIWTPPVCPCCKEMGHLESMCPNVKWSPKPTQEKENQNHESPKFSSASTCPDLPSVTLASPVSTSPDGIILSQSAVSSLLASTDKLTHIVALPAHFSSRPKHKVLKKSTSNVNSTSRHATHISHQSQLQPHLSIFFPNPFPTLDPSESFILEPTLPPNPLLNPPLTIPSTSHSQPVPPLQISTRFFVGPLLPIGESQT